MRASFKNVRKDGTPTQFKNVSYAKAVALQEVGIWSVEDVYKAEIEELTAADGIGKKTARSMKAEVAREFRDG